VIVFGPVFGHIDRKTTSPRQTAEHGSHGMDPVFSHHFEHHYHFHHRGNPTKAFMKRMAEEMIWRVKAAIRSCKFKIAMIELLGHWNFPGEAASEYRSGLCSSKQM
jgi:hypothetical protein